MIDLPEPEFTNTSIEECIAKRRSIRHFDDKALELGDISTILWAAQGITDENRSFRAAPSAGATYPLEIFLCTKEAVYRYIPKGHKLKQVQSKDIRDRVADAALGQMFIADAGLVVIITAVFERTTWRYGERGKRYVYIEVGHCAQNIHLQAVALGLGSVPIGAFDDEELNKILELKGEKSLYIVPIGITE